MAQPTLLPTKTPRPSYGRVILSCDCSASSALRQVYVGDWRTGGPPVSHIHLTVSDSEQNAAVLVYPSLTERARERVRTPEQCALATALREHQNLAEAQRCPACTRRLTEKALPAEKPYLKRAKLLCRLCERKEEIAYRKNLNVFDHLLCSNPAP